MRIREEVNSGKNKYVDSFMAYSYSRLAHFTEKTEQLHAEGDEEMVRLLPQVVPAA